MMLSFLHQLSREGISKQGLYFEKSILSNGSAVVTVVSGFF